MIYANLSYYYVKLTLNRYIIKYSVKLVYKLIKIDVF